MQKAVRGLFRSRCWYSRRTSGIQVQQSLHSSDGRPNDRCEDASDECEKGGRSY